MTATIRRALPAAVRRGIRMFRTAWRVKPASVRGEYAMAVNRLTAGAVMFAATAASAGGGHGDLAFPYWDVAIGTWIVLAGLLFAHLEVYPRPCRARRAGTLVLDVGGASILLHATGSAGTFLYPVYLWVIVGYGVRFGGRYLIAAALLSGVGFGAVVATTPYWQAEPRLAAGLAASLVLVPLYLHLLLRHVAAARAAAERANRAKTLFLAGVSHELRTPLNAIVGMASVLQTTGLNRDQASAVATIDASAEALHGMIKQLLDVSRIEAGQLRAHPEAFDLARLIAGIDAMVRVQAEAKSLRFNSFVSAGTPLDLYGDAERLREVLLGLCANAVKFTAAGFVTVAVGADAGEDGEVLLRAEVTDTGIGIAPEAQKGIFEMFVQADGSIAQRFGGTGVGLAVCEKLIRLLGGRIGVASEPGLGSTFWVTVPVAVRPEAEEVPVLEEPACVVADDPRTAASLIGRLRGCGVEARFRPPEPEPHPSTALAFVAPSDRPVASGEARRARVEVLVPPAVQQGLPPAEVRRRYATAVAVSDTDATIRRAVRIAAAHPSVASRPSPLPEARKDGTTVRVLVADDNPVNRKVLAKILEHAGYEVVTAEDGKQACDALASVDVAFLDVNMPVLSGVDAARIHSSSGAGDRVPILGLTADGTAETAARCLAAGMVACLVKPLRPPALLHALDEALKKHKEDRMERSTPAAQPPGAASAVSALDPYVLAALADIGGEDFVAQIARDFIKEAERLIADVRTASETADLPGFRTHAHAICSCAANVGATALHELCSPWETMSDAELDHAGPGLLQRLDAEWAHTRAALLERAARGPSAAPDPEMHRTHGPVRGGITPL